MILNINNTTKEVFPSDNSYRFRQVMGDNSLTLEFSLAEFYEFPIGTSCEYEGLTYTAHSPASFIKKGIRMYEYKMVLEADQAYLRRYRLKNTVDGRVKFSLTTTPLGHIQQLVDNMNARLASGATEWTIGEVITANDKVISYNLNSCAEALQMIADEFETEWEINGRVISLHKVEGYNEDSPLALS
jgi:hypothetical protein